MNRIIKRLAKTQTIYAMLVLVLYSNNSLAEWVSDYNFTEVCSTHVITQRNESTGYTRTIQGANTGPNCIMAGEKKDTVGSLGVDISAKDAANIVKNDFGDGYKLRVQYRITSPLEFDAFRLGELVEQVSDGLPLKWKTESELKENWYWFDKYEHLVSVNGSKTTQAIFSARLAEHLLELNATLSSTPET